MRQLLGGLAVIWLAATVAFVILRVLPGDIISAQLAQGGASPDEIAAVRDRLQMDDPPLVQYGRFLLGLLSGDLGISLVSYQPVTQLILERLLPTINLAVWAILLAAMTGISIGMLAAYGSGIASLVIILAISTPLYWTGTLAMIVFSAQLGWLPSAGSGSLGHLVLPVGVLAFHTMGEIARVTQVNIREVREAAFVVVARSKGLHESTLRRRHILRVALLPLVTVIALQFGFLLSGAVITESLFVRPGIGRLLLESAIQQDYPVVQGIVLLSAIFYVLLNTGADLCYRFIDPRL